MTKKGLHLHNNNSMMLSNPLHRDPPKPFSRKSRPGFDSHFVDGLGKGSEAEARCTSVPARD